jgi:hypothetical protein
MWLITIQTKNQNPKTGRKDRRTLLLCPSNSISFFQHFSTRKHLVFSQNFYRKMLFISKAGAKVETNFVSPRPTPKIFQKTLFEDKARCRKIWQETLTSVK